MFEVFSEGKTRKYLIVIIYDVVSDKRRNQLSKFLKGYGERVQNSAFECIATKKEYERIIEKAPKLINEEEDLLRIYKLFENNEVLCYGKIGFTEEDEDIIIV